MKLPGKAAVVTGASRGVGKATALALAREGCSVLVNYNQSREDADHVVAAIRKLGPQSIAFAADTADNDACRRMIDAAADAFGRLDFLVNNAGMTRFVPHPDLDALPEELWDRIFAVNVRGPFQCVRAARPHLERHRGHVVNVASVAGLTGNGSSIPYCASKAALINMTQSLARALAPNIQVNAVAPGFIISRWTEDGLGPRFEETKLANERKAPLGKVCQPEDVAAVILSLLTGSNMITGQTLVVDGGAMLGPKS